jgi:hypothetical protein
VQARQPRRCTQANQSDVSYSMARINITINIINSRDAQYSRARDDARPVPVEAIVRIDDGIRNLYRGWVSGALPRKVKTWFKARRLAVITCRYGQNMAIYGRENFVSQGQDWERMRSWGKLRYACIAIASDIK